MRLELSAEQAELVETLQDQLTRFAGERIDARQIDADHDIDYSIVEELADLGLFGLTIPEEYGGAGLGLLGAGTLVAWLARFDRSVATTLGLHLGLGTRGLIAFGSDDLKEEILPALAEGKPIASFAATEAGAGSDLAAVAVTAVQDGEELVVNGEKIFVTNGGWAGVFTILAFTPGLGGARRGHSLLLVKRDDPGVEIGPEEDKLGLRGSSTVSVRFEDVRIPLGRVVGEPGKGMAHIAHVLAWGRTAMAAGCCGTSARALEMSVEHVLTRKQFRKTLSKLDVVKQQIADMAALQFAMEALVRFTAAAEDDHDELAFRSLAAKIVCSDGSWEICDTAIQLHGGSGFIEETTLPLMLRDARITRIFEGANDVLLLHAGSIEAHIERVRPTLPADGPLADLAMKANAIAARVEAHRQALKAEFGLRLVRKHRELHQLGELIVLRQSIDAALLVAETLDTDEARAKAAHWLFVAEQRMDSHFGPLPDIDPIQVITDAYYERAES